MAILNLGNRHHWQDLTESQQWASVYPTAIDYFTKWVEDESYAKLDAKVVAKFIERNIICRFGVPQEIVFDNGTHFEGEANEIMEEYGIQRHKSSLYRP